MKKIMFLLAFIITPVCFAKPQMDDILNVAEIRHAEGELLYSEQAVFISNNIVITTYHGVKGQKDVEVCVTDDARDIPVCGNGHIAKYDEALDLALIVTDFDHSYSYFSDEGVEIGDDIYTVGYPVILGHHLMMTKGIISGFAGDVYVSDAETNPGNSGGAIFNEDGKLIGIHKGVWEAGNGKLACIISLKIITNFIFSN